MSSSGIQMIAGILAVAVLAILIVRHRSKAVVSRRPAAGRR